MSERHKVCVSIILNKSTVSFFSKPELFHHDHELWVNDYESYVSDKETGAAVIWGRLSSQNLECFPGSLTSVPFRSLDLPQLFPLFSYNLCFAPPTSSPCMPSPTPYLPWRLWLIIVPAQRPFSSWNQGDPLRRECPDLLFFTSTPSFWFRLLMQLCLLLMWIQFYFSISLWALCRYGLSLIHVCTGHWGRSVTS